MTDAIPQVLAEIQGGDGLGLSAAGRTIPGHRDNRFVGPTTLSRWITKGVRTPDGRTVKLEAVRVGSRWLTSRAALARFVVTLTDANPSGVAPEPPRRTELARHRACERAVAELKARGA